MLQQVSDHSDLGMFDDHRLHYLGSAGLAVSREQLCSWLVSRARIIGVGSILDGLKNYLDRKPFTTFAVMPLSGIRVESEFQFDNGVSIVPTEKIPTATLSGIADSYFDLTFPFINVGSALVFQFEHPVIVVEQHGEVDRTLIAEHVRWLKLLEEVRLCLTMISTEGQAAQPFGTTIAADDDVPVLTGSAWSIAQSRTSFMSLPVREIQLKTADAFLMKFVQLSETQKDALKIPLSKLNDYASTNDMTQSSIDLRTAMESIFLDGNTKDELRRTIALRAA
ncbi:MAG: hypothetical protein IH960_08405, partial [Chloroflexi bacterium]|nr:hypothetical protein [Chloroflexota bacterium]